MEVAKRRILSHGIDQVAENLNFVLTLRNRLALWNMLQFAGSSGSRPVAAPGTIMGHIAVALVRHPAVPCKPSSPPFEKLDCQQQQGGQYYEQCRHSGDARAHIFPHSAKDLPG